MKISFFEEFPTKRNLEKTKLITWPCNIYVAAKNIQKFKKIKSNITNKKIKVGYWPILKKEEGYWLSPFSSPKAMQRVIDEIKETKCKIMWDAELPLRHPWLFLKIGNYFVNISKIKKLFQQYGKNIITSEYPIKNSLAQLLFQILGVSFSPKKYHNQKIIMYYTSMHSSIKTLFINNIKNLHQKYGTSLQVALGTIATGILGNEPILKPKHLERDLTEMKKIGIKEVVIFRLGGLNKRYINIIKKYIS